MLNLSLSATFVESAKISEKVKIKDQKTGVTSYLVKNAITTIIDKKEKSITYFMILTNEITTILISDI